MRSRRHALGRIAAVAVIIASASGLALAATKLWECNWCHQQYQGDSPPRFVKCPAKDMKQTHWWIQKH